MAAIIELKRGIEDPVDGMVADFSENEAAQARCLVEHYMDGASSAIRDALILGVRLGIELGRRNPDQNIQTLIDVAFKALPARA